METKEQTITIPRNELDFDLNASRQLVAQLRILDRKLQGMLMWCSIAVLTGYCSFVFGILQFQASLPGHHTGNLSITLISIYILFAAFLWLQFRISTYKPTFTQIRLKEFCRFKLQVTARQMKLLAGCLITYALIVFASCIAFWLEAKDNNDAEKLIRVTAPVSILVYVTGLYLLGKLGLRWNELHADIRRIDGEIIKGFNRQ